MTAGRRAVVRNEDVFAARTSASASVLRGSQQPFKGVEEDGVTFDCPYIRVE